MQPVRLWRILNPDTPLQSSLIIARTEEIHKKYNTMEKHGSNVHDES